MNILYISVVFFLNAPFARNIGGGICRDDCIITNSQYVQLLLNVNIFALDTLSVSA